MNYTQLIQQTIGLGLEIGSKLIKEEIVSLLLMRIPNCQSAAKSGFLDSVDFTESPWFRYHDSCDGPLEVHLDTYYTKTEAQLLGEGILPDPFWIYSKQLILPHTPCT
jgi:hypothetical protein